MKLIDTHSHLYSRKFENDIEEVIVRCEEVLSHCFLPNIDLESVEVMKTLTQKRPDFFFPMMGLHPCHVKEDYKTVLSDIEKLLREDHWVGVGETGLDYHWDKTFVAEQKECLQEQINWAKELSLPLILHCRESMEDVIEMVEQSQDGSLRGIFHCFNGTAEQARRIIAAGFLLGIGGVITYKNSGVAEVINDVGIDHTVLETDSPYLAPVPYRGKRNESSYVPIIARTLAEASGNTIAEVARITNANALNLFGITVNQ